MTLFKESKINQLLLSYPRGVVILSSELEQNGYSYALQKHYAEFNWLTSIGYGAYIRAGDKVDVFGGLYALNKLSCNPHIGGRTALNLQGRGQYIDLAFHKIILFSDPDTLLPKWFREYDWKVSVESFTTNFLPPDLGVIEHQEKEFTVSISGPTRALMECLYLAPKKQELSECYELMEGLNNLRPNIVQALLEKCSSVKVKRLFLFLAEHFEHVWFEYLDLDKIDLGKGKRSIVNDGKYDKKYKITVPKKWLET